MNHGLEHGDHDCNPHTAARPPAWTDALAALPALGDPYRDERQAIDALRAAGAGDPASRATAHALAQRWIVAVRAEPPAALSADHLLSAFPLSSREGVALLRLAEALLRAPDAQTQTWLIAEKLATFRDGLPAATAGSFIARVLTLALRLAGNMTEHVELRASGASELGEWLARSALRPLVLDGIRRFGEQFVFAPTLEQALARVRQRPDRRVTHSFDMLGEGARTAADAERGYGRYECAIAGLAAGGRAGHCSERDGLSVKLSALHPRFETAQCARVDTELYGRLLGLARQAREADLGFTIDAEESERLVLQVALVARLLHEPSLKDWEGLGVAVQAYSTRALATVDALLSSAAQARHPLTLRLVKGAYWDAEVKRAQELGLAGFPVFTRKWATDLSYAVLAQRLLQSNAPVYPQFATHNALTAAWVCAVADETNARRPFEFQRLHGMGDALYHALLADRPQARLSVYAPVGAFRDLLAYLVRRLLENGANASFVHQIADHATPIDALLVDPFERTGEAGDEHPPIVSGQRLFGARANSPGCDLCEPATLSRLAGACRRPPPPVHAAPIVQGQLIVDGPAVPQGRPAAPGEVLGVVHDASADDCDRALAAALAAQPAWDRRGVDSRAALLERVGDGLSAAHDEFVALLVHEAGKTLQDAHLEVREAIDFCRYYAQSARQVLVPRDLPGPTGESNQLGLHGRGVFACISPWNFPLAIFVGQIVAALVAGNSVVAKPAEQTPLIATRAVRLMHTSGVPTDVLHLLPGPGPLVGARLVADARLAGVVVTGSMATAQVINRALAAREGPIAVLIAETGGQNAMIVDSSALPEQVTDAVMASAFRSCGQRCSALRVLYVQDEIADALCDMIAGAMRELRIGDPRHPDVDIGPLIDAPARADLLRHRDWLRTHARPIAECELPPGLDGYYFAPMAYEIESMRQLTREHFGPILHVVRFDRHGLERVMDEINGSGYGLTLGVHTRLDARVDWVRARARVGNLYVNRNMIGAVVGSQPFGGEGLSGTGPKAGGPHYLLRLCTERVTTINTAAAGGNIELATGPR